MGPSNPRPQGFLGAHKVLNRLWYLIVSESKRNRRRKSKGTTTRHTKSAGRTVPETRTTRVPRRRVTPLAETDDSRLRAGGHVPFWGWPKTGPSPSGQDLTTRPAPVQNMYFCENCGATKGGPSSGCPAFYSRGDHSYVVGTVLEACIYCDTRPGSIGTRCPRRITGGCHDFRVIPSIQKVIHTVVKK